MIRFSHDRVSRLKGNGHGIMGCSPSHILSQIHSTFFLSFPFLPSFFPSSYFPFSFLFLKKKQTSRCSPSVISASSQAWDVSLPLTFSLSALTGFSFQLKHTQRGKIHLLMTYSASVSLPTVPNKS